MPRKRSFAPSFTLKVLLPSLLAAGGIAVLLLYVVSGIYDEANRLEANYSRILASSAVDTLHENLQSTAFDNSAWDEAADHVGSQVDKVWVFKSWGHLTGDGLYDRVFVVDYTGRTLYAALDGSTVNLSARDHFGADLDWLLKATARGTGGSTRVSATVATQVGPSSVAVGLILEGDATPAGVTQPNRLIIAKRIDDSALGSIGKRYAMNDVAFASDSSSSNSPDSKVDVLSPTGQPVGILAWKNRNPGDFIRAKYGQAVTMLLLMFLFVIVILLYMSWKGFKDANDSQIDAIKASLRDDLTGLANRREMIAVLTDRMAKARADKSALSVIYADLDGFKEVNDSYGHDIGDMLLKAVAAGFAFIGQGADVIARLGGDEFALIFTGEGCGEKAREVAISMTAFLQEPMTFDGRVTSVSVSAGIVDLEDDDADVEEIIRRADVAMYKAKSGGRNRANVYHKSFDFKRDENRHIAMQLREHIAHGNLTVVYQPIVDSRTRRIKGVEALVRWPKDAPIRYTPDVFIPVAEEFGLIEDLGLFVLREACRQAAQWDDIFVAVNVSPIQFMNPSFGDLVEQTLERTGLDAKRLEVEVTEGFIIDNAARANAIIGRLHEMHVRVALDDFGTGFSSIGHLRRFKFDKLKLDRSMVTDILRQPSALRLVQGTIAMADALGLSVVAEGIEDENQVSVLRLAGCNQFQGYLFSRPVEASEIEAFITVGRAAMAG